MLKLVNAGEGEQVALFKNIGIEIASYCNRHCYFCPNGYFDRVDEFMPMTLITKMIAELKELDYRGRIEWYIYNEPTRDKRLAEIIRYCRKQLPYACQMINTNGDYFKSPEDIYALFEAGLNQMQINVYSAADGEIDKEKFEAGRAKAEKRDSTLSQWVAGLVAGGFLQEGLSLYQNIGAKKKTAQVIGKYGIQRSVSDSDVEGPNHFSNRSGNIPGFRSSVTEPLNKHCTRPFRFLNINWKGQAILCCNDYYGQTNFGNVAKESLVEIWNSVEFNMYRLKLQNKRRNCFLCHNCDFNGGYYSHMIDNVTFGSEAKDKGVLEADLTSKDSFKLAVPIEKQGKINERFLKSK